MANDNRHGEDRRELRSSVEQLTSSINLLNQGMGIQAQTLQSIGAQLVRVNDEKYSQRLGELETMTKSYPSIEENIKFWLRIGGAGWGALWRVVGVLASCGAISAAVAHFTR